MSISDFDYFAQINHFVLPFSRPLSPNSIYIAAGNFSTNAPVVKYVKSIFVHTEYDDKTLENDIAVIMVIKR